MSLQNEEIDRILKLALDYLNQGKIAIAEHYVRDVLYESPNSDAANFAMGIIAAKLGLRDKAIDYFERARENTDTMSIQIDNQLMRCRSMVPNNIDQISFDRRYMVIKAWGAGFWSDISHILGSLLLAEATNRVPIVHQGKKSRYGTGNGADSFSLYFAPVSRAKIEDFVEEPSTTYFPHHWNNGNIKSQETYDQSSPPVNVLVILQNAAKVVVADVFVAIASVIPWLPSSHLMHKQPVTEVIRYLVKKYLHPHDYIMDECREFVAEEFGNNPFVCIHLRGSDKSQESDDTPTTNETCISELKGIDPSWKVLLITDDKHYLLRMKKLYGPRLVTTNCFRAENTAGVHFISAEGFRLGREIMIDSYLATFASKFIGNANSNVAGFISYLKKWKKNDCLVINKLWLHQRYCAIDCINPYYVVMLATTEK